VDGTETFSEDLLFSDAHTCELWIHGFGGATGYASNFRLYGTMAAPVFTHIV
jgi:hypothetical protein